MDAQSKEHRDRFDNIDYEMINIKQKLERPCYALETTKLNLDELAPHIQELRQRQQKLQTLKCETEAFYLIVGFNLLIYL